MAAVIHPVPNRDRALPARSPLRLVEGGRSPHQAGLYRRRRLMVAVGVLVAVMLTVLGAVALLRTVRADVPGSTAPAANAPARADVRGPVVVVRPGDTLWSIARRVTTGGDVRATVDRLASIHGTGPLQVGERLPVDAGSGGGQMNR